MIAGERAIALPQLLARRHCKGTQALWCDRRADLLDMRHRPLGVAPGLIAGRRQFGDPIPERRIAYVDHAILDRVIEALEPSFGFGRAAFQIGDMETPLIHPFVAAFEDLIHQFLKPLRIEQPPL
ncbi:hypothetical protein [Sphingomonas sp. BE137]|uniref:hypothetical protein n=1 Tax=Sphingomonas sp. BE137 TaxID=2817844 RepID=UPI00286AB06E|nr:hypothetical protein [Sphingomonas sp. BE137]